MSAITIFHRVASTSHFCPPPVCLLILLPTKEGSSCDTHDAWLFLCWFVGNENKQFKCNIYSIYSRLWFKRCPTNELACPRFQNRAVIDFDFT